MHAPLLLILSSLLAISSALPAQQVPLLRHAANNRTVSAALFADLEELARIVDISYCVGLTGTGISKPFKCLSRCSEFPDFELLKVRAYLCHYLRAAHKPTCC